MVRIAFPFRGRKLIEVASLPGQSPKNDSTEKDAEWDDGRLGELLILFVFSCYKEQHLYCSRKPQRHSTRNLYTVGV